MRYEDDEFEVEDEWGIDWQFEVIHKSRPPLRWIANLAGSIASRGLLDISYMEDAGYTGWRYKVNLWLWDYLYPFYDKYGTYYKLKGHEEEDI
jgi:hypothetical protein